MSYLNEDFLSTVTPILIDKKGTATGFYFRVISKEELDNEKNKTKQLVFLVTNRHVVNYDSSFVKRLTIKMHNSKLNDFVYLDLNILPNNNTFVSKKSDLAIIDIQKSLDNVYDLKKQSVDEAFINQISFLDKTSSYKIKDYLDAGGFEASPITMIGYPLGLFSLKSKRPIVRSGTIARIDLSTLFINENFFLGDINSFPGSSGSPVFSRIDGTFIKDSKMIKETKLIDINFGYWPSENDKNKENSGLETIIPYDELENLINDTLNTSYK